MEITPRECAIVSASLHSLLESSLAAGSSTFAAEVDSICRIFSAASGDSRVDSVLMFLLAKGSDRILYKLADAAKTGRNVSARARRAPSVSRGR